MAGFSRGGRRVLNDEKYGNHTWINSPDIRHRRCSVCGARMDCVDGRSLYTYPNGDKVFEMRGCTGKPKDAYDKVSTEILVKITDEIIEEYGVEVKDLSFVIGTNQNTMNSLRSGRRLITSSEVDLLDKEFNDFGVKERINKYLGL